MSNGDGAQAPPLSPQLAALLSSSSSPPTLDEMDRKVGALMRQNESLQTVVRGVLDYASEADRQIEALQLRVIELTGALERSDEHARAQDARHNRLAASLPEPVEIAARHTQAGEERDEPR